MRSSAVRKILEHLGEAPGRRASRRRGDRRCGRRQRLAPAGNDPQTDLAAQPVREVEFDQRVAW